VNGRVWPHDADHQVTVRATFEQYVEWTHTAHLLAIPHAAAYLAHAGDFVAKYIDRLDKRFAKKEERKKRAAREAKEGA
jgi:hypothetical protein